MQEFTPNGSYVSNSHSYVCHATTAGETTPIHEDELYTFRFGDHLPWVDDYAQVYMYAEVQNYINDGEDELEGGEPEEKDSNVSKVSATEATYWCSEIYFSDIDCMSDTESGEGRPLKAPRAPTAWDGRFVSVWGEPER